MGPTFSLLSLQWKLENPKQSNTLPPSPFSSASPPLFHWNRHHRRPKPATPSLTTFSDQNLHDTSDNLFWTKHSSRRALRHQWCRPIKPKNPPPSVQGKDGDCKGVRIQKLKSIQAESCMIKHVTTCICSGGLTFSSTVTARTHLLCLNILKKFEITLGYVWNCLILWVLVH